MIKSLNRIKYFCLIYKSKQKGQDFLEYAKNNGIEVKIQYEDEKLQKKLADKVQPKEEQPVQEKPKKFKNNNSN